MREARCTIRKNKPIALVHDPVRGGGTLDFIKQHECPDGLRSAIFDGRDVIEWHRIKVRAELRLVPRRPLDNLWIALARVPFVLPGFSEGEP